MATVVSELINIIGFKVNKAESQKVERAFTNLSRKVESAATRLSIAFTLPFALLTKSIATNLSNFEQLDVAFTTILGNAEKAKGLLNELFTLAAKTPFGVFEITQNAKQLLAMGIESEKLIETLTNLGNVSAGLSVPLQRLALNFGQVRTRGKLTGQELRDFAIAGVPLIAQLAKQLNVSEKAIADLVSKGAVSFKDVETAFRDMATGSGKFSDLMIKQSKTLGGLWSNFKDLLLLSIKDMETTLLPAFKKIVLQMIRLTRMLEKLDPQLKAILFWAGAFVAIVPPLILGFSALVKVVIFAQEAFIALRVAAAAANTTMLLLIGKFLLVGAAIAVVLAVLALVIEDIIVFQRGGKSLIGTLIDGFDRWKKQMTDIGIFIPEIFANIVSDLNNMLNSIIELLFGVFTGNFKFAFNRLGQFIKDWASTVFDLIGAPIQRLLDLMNFLTGSNLKVPTSSDVAKVFGDIAFPSVSANNLQSIRQGGAVPGQNSVNVNSNITLNFPVGTDTGIINTAENQLRKAARDEMMFQINELVTNNPKVE
ncbi:MAG: tape measure protein [Saprospiraceae bacterium]